MEIQINQIPVKYQGRQHFLTEANISSLPEIVRREILYPKLSDQQHGSAEREKVTARLITMLGVKFETQDEMKMARAELAALFKTYQLTGEEVLEAYRMGIKKTLVDHNGQVIQIYPNLSVIQAGEVLNAYQNFKIDNRQHTLGVETLKKLASPEVEISPEEKRKVRKELWERVKKEVSETGTSAAAFRFYDFAIKHGAFKSFLTNTDAQEKALKRKMIQIVQREKIKPKMVLFTKNDLADLSKFLKGEIQPPYSYQFLEGMAIAEIQGEMVVSWIKKKLKNEKFKTS